MKLRLESLGLGLFAWAVLCGGMLAPSEGYAQVAGATLTGTITDPSGAVIPNAQVSIQNTATGVVTQVQADTDGLYAAPNLVPGTYEVTVSAAGFVTQVMPGITLTVGTQQVLNVKMRVGQATQRVEVSGQAAAVQLASSSINAVVNSTTVRELPLNGRSWTDLAALQPGVDTIVTQPSFTTGANRGNRGFGSEVSIAGARPQQNNYRLDGISMNDYANGAPGSVSGGDLGVDAIQEFSVLTSNYSAEYGKTSGGVVNAITKSGTNQFHGSAYEFLRNSSLDARNFFDQGGVPQFRRNQFGASAGGPIQKDRTFIFGDYEGVRQSQGVSNLVDVPSVAARSGNLCSNLTAPFGAPGDCTPRSVSVDPSAQKYLVFFHLPNAGLVPGGDGDTGFYNFVANQALSENFFTSRIDRKFSDKDSLFGSYLFDRTPYSAPDQLNEVLLGNLSVRQLITVEETHIFRPNLVNTIRVGFNRESANVDNSIAPINSATADLSLGAEPTRAAAQVFISGVPPGFTGGMGANPTYLYRWNSFQGYDDAFFTHGTHSLKFGGAVERIQDNDLPLSNPNGVFNFGSLEAFLTNKPSKYNSGIASTLQPRGYRQTYFGAYLQDDWRIRPNLMLNLGLRYEFLSVPTEVQGRIVHLLNITDPLPVCGRLAPGCGSTGPFFHNPTTRDFAPRVGFAWDAFGNGKTAVRGGFGVFDSLPLPYEYTGLDHLAAPFFAIGAVSNKNGVLDGSFYQGAAALLQPGTLRGAYIDEFPKRNYVMQWNFTVEQEVTPSVTALAGYVGSRGVHMPFTADDIDLVLPTLTSAGYLYPNPDGSGTRFNNNFGQISGRLYMGNAFFDALELAVTKRLSHGVQFQTSFTWGKSIDTNSASVAGDQFSNGISSLNWYDQSLTRGLSDFNVGRTLVTSLTWQVPQFKSLTGAAGWIANGWELGGIFKANDGVPYTPTWGTGADPAGTLSADDYAFPDIVSGPGCKNLTNPGNPNHYVKTQCFTVPTAPSAAFYSAAPPLGCDPTFGTFPQCFNLRGNAGRNIIIGPGVTTLDFSLFKNNYIKRISESFNIQFRAEFFNILNHPNFGIPNLGNGEADLFDGTGAPIGTVGQLTSTTTSAREIQFALKVVW